MSLWSNFLDGFSSLPEKVDGTLGISKNMVNLDKNVVNTIESILDHSVPYIAIGGCIAAGVYGLPTYLAGDFTKSTRDKFIKEGLIGDFQKAFWGSWGYEEIDEAKAKKIKMKNKGKPSEDVSFLSMHKSIYK